MYIEAMYIYQNYISNVIYIMKYIIFYFSKKKYGKELQGFVPDRISFALAQISLC